MTVCGSMTVKQFVIPLRVSGIYAGIPRRYDVGLLSSRCLLAGSM
ncbi:MAG: hypothetical protein ACEY3L_00970 [Wolbachia sp.]